MDSAELKECFSKRVSLISADRSSTAQLFAQLYADFQTEIVHRVCCTTVVDRPYTWVDPVNGRSSHVIVFFHGGGYTMGSANDHMQLIASLVELSGTTVLAVDYRLFPEVRFPDPLDDAETLKIGKDGNIIEIGQKPSSLDEVEGQYIGLMKFTSKGISQIKSTFYSIKENESLFNKSLDEAYMTDLLQTAIDLGNLVTPVFINGDWVEVDTVKDMTSDVTLNRLNSI